MIHNQEGFSFHSGPGWWPATLIFLWMFLVPVSSTQANITTISGVVKGAEGGSLNGLVLIEKGRLYNKKFRYGGLIKNGRFSVRVDGGGTYGLHLYATGYVYFPIGMSVESGQDNTGQYKLPPNPAQTMAPVIGDIKFITENDGTLISLAVYDPNHDLSHQVLALNNSTGEAFRMDPPGFVLPLTKTYPEGVYTLLFSGKRVVDTANWYFIAADNKCYSSPVLGTPFTTEGIMRARKPGESGEGDAAGEHGKVPIGKSIVSGQEVFKDNCSMCHLADSDKVKVGPGLKGLYSLNKTPALNNPLTDKNIRKQILEGGKDMPPYSHLTEEEVNAVLDYLKTL